MKKILLISLALICAYAFSSAGERSVFYVSPVGSDNAPGTLRRPWKSPSYAVKMARKYMRSHPGADVELIFRGGDYLMEEGMSFDGNGLSGTLTLASAEGERACFKGDRPVTGWSRYKGNIWMADLRTSGIADCGQPVGYDDRLDLYHNGKRQTLSRWPDKGFTKAGRAVGATELPSPDWIQYHGAVEGELEYLDDRIDKWVCEKDAYCFGYFYWDWAETVSGIASIDTLAAVLRFEKPYSQYGYRDGCRFYGFNLMCELDCPGEYYVDRTAGIIYWYAPDGTDPEGENMTLSVYNKPYMLELVDAGGTAVDNLSFCGSRRGGILVIGGDDVSISSCEFSCLGDIAVSFWKGSGHKVDGCYLHELGRGGIHARGGDRKTLTSSLFSVTNTVVEDFALFKRTYQPAIYFYGVGLDVSHNRFCNSSSSALRLEGNDITVEYNQFENLVNESDDQGRLTCSTIIPSGEPYTDSTISRIYAGTWHPEPRVSGSMT